MGAEQSSKKKRVGDIDYDLRGGGGGPASSSNGNNPKGQGHGVDSAGDPSRSRSSGHSRLYLIKRSLSQLSSAESALGAEDEEDYLNENDGGLRSEGSRGSRVEGGSTAQRQDEKHSSSRFKGSRSKQDSKGSLVVVRSSKQITDRVEDDPVLLRLQGIPEFHSILRDKDKINWSREGEVIRERLYPQPMLNIVALIEALLSQHSLSIQRKQVQLTRNIKELNRLTGLMVKMYTERQRKFAKHAEKISQVNSMIHSLAKCHAVLNHCKDLTVSLNSMLPSSERLEPFVWTEDQELVEIRQSVDN